jgi:hypothetical protein
MALASSSGIGSFYRGDSKNFRLTFKDSSGVAIDITGFELWFTMKSSVADLDASAAVQKVVTFAAGADATAGIGELALSSVDTAVTPGIYFYDFQLVDPTATPPIVTTITSGKVTVLQDVTVTDVQ